jgi:hypothetical protein
MIMEYLRSVCGCPIYCKEEKMSTEILHADTFCYDAPGRSGGQVESVPETSCGSVRPGKELALPGVQGRRIFMLKMSGSAKSCRVPGIGSRRDRSAMPSVSQQYANIPTPGKIFPKKPLTILNQYSIILV